MNTHSVYDFVKAGKIESSEIKNKMALKDYFKNLNAAKTIGYYENRENEFHEKFTFIDKNECSSIIGKNKKRKVSEFSFMWLKYSKIHKEIEFKAEKVKAENSSGIFQSTEELLKYLKKLPFYSFAITAEIELKAPYFSKDDDNFYLVNNPVLKEKVYKVPMVKGSAWKGAAAAASKELLNEDLNHFSQFARIFGLGSSEYRNLLHSIEGENKENIIRAIISLCLFELGLSLDKKDIDDIKNNPFEFLLKLSENLNIRSIKDNAIFPYLQPNKGRVIFYPTYFSKISYEVINPHDRQRRAGINPIFYEVVPKGTVGKLQLIYIPYDAILTEKEALKEQIKKDLSFLCRAIEKTANQGIGAKTKLGWGRFEMKDKKICVFDKDLSVEGWDKCWI